MLDVLSTAVSVAALTLSGTTMWLTLLRGGQVKMTQPTLFYLGPDGANNEERKRGGPKVFVRTLLHSTGRRGIVVENMYVTVARGETRQNFNIWVYRDKGLLSRGSGLFVGYEGLALDHHFLLPADGTSFDFIAGEYTIQVFAKLVRDRKPRMLGAFAVRLPEAIANDPLIRAVGVYFDWGPDLGRYHAHIRPLLDSPAIDNEALTGRQLQS